MPTRTSPAITTTAPGSHRKTQRSPRNVSGVLVVDGYGISISVDRGQLVVIDGNGRNRRRQQLPKAGHGVERLVVIGRAGSVTLEALRWMDRTGITFLHLDNDGTPLTVYAAYGTDDARLRRSQAIAAGTTSGLDLTRYLLGVKIGGQADTAHGSLGDDQLSDRLRTYATSLETCPSIPAAVQIEATAAVEYFAQWPGRVAIRWAKADLKKVPDRWFGFQARRSPLSAGSSIRAADPVNAILNYLYALAETECVLACRTLGLDPGLGIIHTDVKNRDSLALDLIETVRPVVDAYLIDLCDGHVFSRKDFIEQDDGHVRVAAPLTHHLAQTLPTWRAAVASHAEHVAHVLADASPYRIAKPTPLTSKVRRSTATAGSASRRKNPKRLPGLPKAGSIPVPPAGCVDCGETLRSRGRVYCSRCWATHRLDNGRRGSRRAAEQVASAQGRIRRGAAISQAKAAAIETAATDAGISARQWHKVIQPKVSRLTLREIMEVTGLSQSYVSKIKRGVHTPHPRHWQALQAATIRR